MLWIWLVVAGIIFSGYMTVRAIRIENKLNEMFIEEEGNKYINRIEEEKRMRLDSQI